MKGSGFEYRDTLFDFSTLSPSGKFFYRITKPESINMANFASHIAFFTFDTKLLYYRKETYAHWITPDPNSAKFYYVYWAEDVDVAYFFEYERDKIYDAVFLDFEKNRLFRLNLERFEEEVEKMKLDNMFSFSEVLRKLTELQIPPEPFYKDEFKSGIFNRWYP